MPKQLILALTLTTAANCALDSSVASAQYRYPPYRYSARAARYRTLYLLVRDQQQAVVKAAQEQNRHAAAVVAAAESREAQAKAALSLALQEMRSANSELQTALDQESGLRKELSELESDILSAQPAGSPYADTRAQFLEAQAEVQKLETKLTGTSAYQAKKATLAKTPGEGPPAVAKFRHDTLYADADYRDAQTKLNRLAGQMNALRHALLENNLHYQSAHEEWVSVKKDAREADAAVWHGSAKRAAPLAEIRSAEQAAESARRLMSQAQAVIDTYNTPAVKSASKSTR